MYRAPACMGAEFRLRDFHDLFGAIGDRLPLMAEIETAFAE